MKHLWFIVSLAGMAWPAGGPSHTPADTSTLLPVAEDNFKLVKVDGAVSLYERWLEVEPGREAREMKAEFTAPGAPDEAVALLRNEVKAMEWMRRVGACRIMADGSAQSWLSYVRYDIPWPVSDQDCLLRYELKKTGNQIHIPFRSAIDDKIPPKSKVKRMKGITGSWLLEPQAGNKTYVTYTIMTTEKPTLPRWITDPLVQGNLLDTMNAFRSQLKG